MAAVEGKLDRDRLLISVDPTHLEYRSADLFLDVGGGKEKAPLCFFVYDCAKKSWTGTIPLEKAKLVQHSFGIAFEEFSSQLKLEGSLFSFQNVSALTNGVLFEGSIAVDYQYDDYAELLIDTTRIEGSARAAQLFLRHFQPFQTIDCALEGQIQSGKGGMHLRAHIGQREELLSWHASMTLKNGSYAITPLCAFEGLSTRFEWSFEDQTMSLLDSEGYLRVGEANFPKNYRLNIPVAQFDLKRGRGSYDIRLETPTHDICRVVGEAKRRVERDGFAILLDPEVTRFFGAKVTFGEFIVGSAGGVSRLDLETKLSSRDLYHHLDFLAHAGLLPVKPAVLEEMQSPRFEGEMSLTLSLDEKKEFFAFEAKSDLFTFGTIHLDHLLMHAERRGDELNLDHFSAGGLTMKARMVKEKKLWAIPMLYIDWKDCKLRSEEGLYHKEKGLIQLSLKHLNINLSEIFNVFPTPNECDHTYFKGKIATCGTLECDLSGGLKEAYLDATLQLIGQECTKGDLQVESADPIHLYFSPSRGIEVKKAAFHFFYPPSIGIWAKCQLEALHYDIAKKEWRGEGCTAVVPPEMLRHLASAQAIPYLRLRGEELSLGGHCFKWENQVELAFAFSFGNVAEVRGHLKEGYYWIGDKAWYVNDFTYHLKEDWMDLKVNTLLDDHPFDLRAKMQLLPHLKTQITIAEAIIEEPASFHPLTIVSNWSENEGFFIQSIEGGVSGLDFSFHHNPRGSFLDQMTLTGQLRLNMPKLAKCLPLSIRGAIKELEIGRGYELSGDWVISKENFSDSHFTGYLKGKRFELMGSEMETLMGEITIHADHIELSNFNLSDVSGIFSIDDICLSREEDKRWKVSIPNICVQDFRPSLLKKIGRYRGRIKPLNIREMSFHNVRGFVGDVKSFTGQGSLSFTNTFKSNYNILDIPFEILGRLGLDMGLLVPIRRAARLFHGRWKSLFNRALR